MLKIDLLDIAKPSDGEPNVLIVAEDGYKNPQAQKRWRLLKTDILHSLPVAAETPYDRSWVLVSGGPVELEEEGKRPRRLPFLAPITLKSPARAVLNVFEAGQAYELRSQPGKVRAGLYPTLLRKAEDYQFPLPGQKHVLVVINGEVNVRDRNSQSQHVLRSGQALLLSRDAEECLNLQAVAESENATVIWAVIHELA